MDSILGITITLIFLFIFGWGIYYTVKKPNNRPYPKSSRPLVKRKLEEQESNHQPKDSEQRRPPSPDL